MHELTIANTTIRRDDAGRYSFNDLHAAAVATGHDYKACQVSNFTRLDSTEALITQLRKSEELEVDPWISTSGRYGGTWGCKELVYAYAMWISPVFHLEVIRAYDTTVSNRQVSLASSKFYDKIPKNLPEALRLAAAEMEKNVVLEEKLAIAGPKAEALDRISASEEAVTMTQAAKLLGIKRETLTNYLHANGWVYRQNGTWVAYEQHIKNERLQFKEARYTDQKTGQECHSPYCHILPKGLALLARHFAAKEAA